MSNEKQKIKLDKSTIIILVILGIVILSFIGIKIFQSIDFEKDYTNNTEIESTSDIEFDSSITEQSTEPSTESATQSTTEATTQKRETDNEIIFILSKSQWVNNSGENYLVFYDGTMECEDSNYTLQESMLYSIYARNDNKYDFEITYKDGTTEKYVMTPDFSYDENDLLHYEYDSYMKLEGNGKFAGEWLFLTYFG